MSERAPNACPHCNNSGFILYSGPTGPMSNMACTCAAGSKYAERDKPKR